jgi:hypothetical protein
VRFNVKLLRSGIDTHTIERVPVRISNPARTVVELFRYRQSAGRSIAERSRPQPSPKVNARTVRRHSVGLSSLLRECSISLSEIRSRLVLSHEANCVHLCRSSCSSLVPPMPEWQYISINLSDFPFKPSVIDLLNDAGRNGWELVAITLNNIAYLKRQIGQPPVNPARASATSTP